MIQWVRRQVTHKPHWAYIKVILLGSSATMVLCRQYTLYPCTLKWIPLPKIHPTQPNPIHSDPIQSNPIQSSPVQSVARCSEVIPSVIFEACELFNESLAPWHCSQCIVDPGQRRTESGWRPLRRYSPKLCHLQGLSFDLLWPAAVCPPSRLNVGKAFYAWGRDLCTSAWSNRRYVQRNRRDVRISRWYVRTRPPKWWGKYPSEDSNK